MVNEEKVILMTKIAMYKESIGREDLDKGKYFQSDYVKLNCLKTIVSSTVLFIVVAASYIYYNLAELVEQLTEMDYMKIALQLIGAYAVICLGFAMFAWVLYTYRYLKAKPKLIKYNQNLKKLIEFYENEEGPKGSGKKKRRAR
ncbi:MAG: hypothetical protein J6A82_01355 [Coprococcus sp.]|nr:hypothetical protein [Coprococcus sp.]